MMAGFGLLLVILGPVAYMLLIDIPWLRSSGIAAFVLMGAGTILAVRAALMDRRLRCRSLAVLSLLITATWLVGFFILARIPQAPDFAALQSAPDFTLPDEEGRPVSMKAAVSEGPVLLVFYRGFW